MVKLAEVLQFRLPDVLNSELHKIQDVKGKSRGEVIREIFKVGFTGYKFWTQNSLFFIKAGETTELIFFPITSAYSVDLTTLSLESIHWALGQIMLEESAAELIRLIAKSLGMAPVIVIQAFFKFALTVWYIQNESDQDRVFYVEDGENHEIKLFP